MPTKKNESAENVVRKEMRGFNVAKKAKPDSTRFLPADNKTPDVAKLHKKYQTDSPEVAVVAAAKPKSNPSATKAVVIEPKERRADGSSKTLTVLVKQGKIRAVQG
jgi:hypothetical protein